MYHPTILRDRLLTVHRFGTISIRSRRTEPVERLKKKLERFARRIHHLFGRVNWDQSTMIPAWLPSDGSIIRQEKTRFILFWCCLFCRW
jgi:hypothetical protein